MGQIGELDLPTRLARFAPAWLTQLAFALLCAAGAAAGRTALDVLVPGAGPFTLGVPFLLIATLFARWQAGLVTAALSVLHGWYFTLPYRGSFALETPSDASRIWGALLLYAVVLAIAELFRSAVRSAAAERDRQIAERDLLLEEFDHRVKNNFTLVASLLDLQRRRAANPDTADALAAAIARVESIARAHRHLYRGSTSPDSIDIAAYLQELCDALEEALFLRGAIRLRCASDAVAMPRDRAVAIGLIVNELVTNAAKHAFKGRDTGTIAVTFGADGSGWRLTVTDDGAGIEPAQRKAGGLGQRLIEGFARQAGGTVATESGPGGTTVTVRLAG